MRVYIHCMTLGFLHQSSKVGQFQLTALGIFDGFSIQMPACQKRSIGGRRENLLMSDQIHVMSRWSSRELLAGMHILKCVLALTPFEVDVSWHFKKTHYLCCCHVWNFSTWIAQQPLVVNWTLTWMRSDKFGPHPALLLSTKVSITGLIHKIVVVSWTEVIRLCRHCCCCHSKCCREACVVILKNPLSSKTVKQQRLTCRPLFTKAHLIRLPTWNLEWKDHRHLTNELAGSLGKQWRFFTLLTWHGLDEWRSWGKGEDIRCLSRKPRIKPFEVNSFEKKYDD